MAFGLEKWAEKNYDWQFLQFRKTSVSVIRLSSLSAGATMLINNVPTLLIMTPGSFSVMQVSDLWTSYKTYQAFYDRITEVLDFSPGSEGSHHSQPTRREIYCLSMFVSHMTTGLFLKTSTRNSPGRSII
ncbi:MAG: hypothetical protein WCF90_05640 [Methanomicrobiales archaeon]